MKRFLSHLWRFIVISIAYVLALLAASGFIVALILGGILQNGVEPGQLGSVAFSILIVAYAGFYSFVPAFAFALIAEFSSKRSWLFHALGGMFVATIGITMFDVDLMDSGRMAVSLAAGAVGGTVYWLFAGRNAGRHFDTVSDSASSGF